MHCLVFIDKRQEYLVVPRDYVSPILGDEISINQICLARENDLMKPEVAKLLFIGTKSDCHHQYSLQKIPDSKKQKKSELIIREKDEEIEKLKNEIENLKYAFQIMNDNLKSAEDDNLNLRIELNEAKSQKVDSVAYEALYMPTVESNIAEILRIVRKLENGNIDNTNSNIVIDNELVALKPDSTILVSKTRFQFARTSPSPTGFIHRILTAIFPYNQLIGKTLTGRKRRNPDEPNTDDDCLDQQKVSELIDATVYYYRDAKVSNLRQAITSKTNHLSRGEMSQMDCIQWDGFDHHEFQSLKLKKRKSNATFVD